MIVLDGAVTISLFVCRLCRSARGEVRWQIIPRKEVQEDFLIDLLIKC